MGLLNEIFRSLKKSKKLRNISLVLGKEMDISDIRNSMLGIDNSRRKAEEDLYNLVASDPNLKIIMQKHGANKETLKEIFEAVEALGAGQWVKGHYVAASALAFRETLDYLLSNKNKLTSSKDNMEICYRLITYFDWGETNETFA